LKRLGVFVVTSIIAFFILLDINVINVKAVVPYYSDSDAMSYAPYGIPLGNLDDNSLFVQGSHTSGNNSVINGDALQLTQKGQNNQVSSVWSNMDNNNYIDTGKKQTLSVWLYFGYSLYNSEGMAFVLQNDPNGTSAIAKNGNDIAGGETIGVWGSDLKNKATSTDLANSAIQKSWALEFDANVNGDQDSNDINNKTGGAPGGSFDSYQMKTMRGIHDQHLAWAYPGRPETYTNVGSQTSTVWSGGLISIPNQVTTNYYEMNHNDVEETTLSPAATADLAWHHMVVTYTPPTDADPNNATLEYKYNDKTLAGYAQNLKTGQNLISHSINLNLSYLGVKKGDPLRFGFTAANGVDDDHTETNTVLFESIPSLVDADANAYVVDKTDKTKVSSSTDVMDKTDKSLNDVTSVHPKDDLQFNYMLRYNSGKEAMKPVTAKVDLPTNVTITSDGDGSIGKVIYSDGSYENIPVTDLNDDKTVLTHVLSKGLSSSLSTAKVELNATADAVPDANSALQVPISHASLEGANYKTDVQTPTFNIIEPQDTLTIAKTSEDPVTVAEGKTVNLTGNMSFKNLKTAINNNDMDIYYSVDGGKTIDFKDTDSGSGNFVIPFSSSDAKKHTIEVQVVDSNYVSPDGTKDVVSSNTLTYTVNVEDLSLIASASNNNPIDKLNDTTVALPNITVKHNDGSNIESGNLKVNYSITNPNSNDGKAVVGIETPMILGGDGTADGSETFSLNVTKDMGLRVGQNTVDVTVTDPGGHTSNKLTFVINVEDKNPVLTYGDKNNGKMTVVAADDSITFPLNIAYEDNIRFKPSDLKFTAKVDGEKTITLPKLTSSSLHDSLYFEETIDRAKLGLDANKNVKTHTVTFQATDPYGRVSKELTFNLDMVYSSANLTYKDSYSFGSLNQSPESRLVKRTSDWDIGVNTVDSQYKLTASAGPLTAGGPTDSHTLAGGLIYVDPNTGNSQSMTDPVTLSENNSDTTYQYHISNKWAKNQGILLQVNSNASAGSYSGKINWNLTDSI